MQRRQTVCKEFTHCLPSIKVEQGLIMLHTVCYGFIYIFITYALAYSTAAIDFAHVFYCNHVSLWGSDSCAAADFRVLPVETTQCEDKAQSRERAWSGNNA